MTKNKKALSKLAPGEGGIISDIKNDGSMRRRLMDLGFIKDSEVQCVAVAPFGDPKAFYIKDTLIALRYEDSSKIFIKKI